MECLYGLAKTKHSISDRRPQWLYPIFYRASTNQFFMQNTSKSGIVQSFFAIEITGFELLEKLVDYKNNNPTIVSIGDEAICSCILNDPYFIVTDTYTKFKEKLSILDLEKRGHVFFNADVYAFLGNYKKSMEALDKEAEFFKGNDDYREYRAKVLGKKLTPKFLVP